MSKNFHKTDGALLGSCGDIRHDETEAMALLGSYQMATNIAMAVQAMGEGVGAWRRNRQEKFEQRESALTDHAELTDLLAQRRARQAQPTQAPRTPLMRLG